MDYKTGTLIEFRNRPWVVQQSAEDNLMIIKPLGGTDAETIGLYLPLYGDELQIHSAYLQPIITQYFIQWFVKI